MVFEHFESFGGGFGPFWAVLTRAPNRQSARFGENWVISGHFWPHGGRMGDTWDDVGAIP